MSDRDRTKPIKVVRIIARLNVGGPAIHAIMLTRELENASFSSTLITGVVGKGEGDITPEAYGQGVQPVVIPELGREIVWKDDARAFWKLLVTIRAIKPDIVHTHTAKAGFLGRIAALLAGVPVKVHTFHGHVFHGYFGPIKTKLFLLLERWLARITDRLIVVSESQRQELIHRYRLAGAAKIQVIPLGFDLSPFEKLACPGAARTRLAIPSDVLLVGLIGRLVPIKNPALLIEALALLHATALPQKIHAVIVGGGELEDSLKREATHLGLDRQVTFLGWRRDMAGIYADLDLVVVTSVNEGTPVALIEAMASGRPFIATKVGGVPDLMCGPGQEQKGAWGAEFSLFGNGILIPSNNPRALASALSWVLDHRETMQSMGEVGRAFALERFAKERLVQDIHSLYTDLLVAKGRA